MAPTALNSMRRGGHSYPALGKLRDLAYPGLVLFVVFVALICGGGTRQGLWSDALAQIVSLPLLAVAAFRLKALTESIEAAAAVVSDLCRRPGTSSATGPASPSGLDDPAGKSGGGRGLYSSGHVTAVPAH